MIMMTIMMITMTLAAVKMDGGGNDDDGSDVYNDDIDIDDLYNSSISRYSHVTQISGNSLTTLLFDPQCANVYVLKGTKYSFSK